MATSPPDRAVSAASMVVTAVAATAAETRPLRRRLGRIAGVGVEQGGVGLAQWVPGGHDDLLLSCGLAGGLDPRLTTGTVVIPESVALGTDPAVACDPTTVALLRDAAARCGAVMAWGPLVTVDHVVAGPERSLWSDRGYAAVDMESALLCARAARFAAVRVVLDTPGREISRAWAAPGRAMARPWLWGEALWLARVAPELCDLVARIVAEALSPTRSAPARGMSAPPARRDE